MTYNFVHDVVVDELLHAVPIGNALGHRARLVVLPEILGPVDDVVGLLEASVQVEAALAHPKQQKRR